MASIKSVKNFKVATVEQTQTWVLGQYMGWMWFLASVLGGAADL